MARPLVHLAFVLVVLAASLTACGDDGKPAAAPPGSPENPLVAETQQPPERGATGEPTPASGRSDEPPAKTRPSGKPAKAMPSGEPAESSAPSPAPAAKRNQRAPNYQQLVQQQPRNPQRRFTPCNLVTAGEARAIVGAPMQTPVEAPQGPSCIYRTQTGNSLIALAVAQLDFKQIKPRIRSLQRFTLSDRQAYCGTYGQPMLYLPLARGRVLSVSAKCSVAKDFAAKALPHL